jgi:hypothetical protein
MELREIDIAVAKAFVKANHYSEVMPRITKVVLGTFEGERLVGVMTLGWGTRPMHTIKKLFPSLDTLDYLEIGKMCALDEMPKNFESQFLSGAIKWLKKNRPTVKVLYTWADGIIGKPGYVYQAANFAYGGYIWTEMYLDKNGNRVHVRSMQGHPDLPQSTGKMKSRALSLTMALGYTKYWGLQFRYCYPLCNKRDWLKLQAESTVKWFNAMFCSKAAYPKDADCKWKRQDGPGLKIPCDLPKGIRTKYITGP